MPKFEDLVSDVRAQGLLRRSYGHYVLLSLFLAFGFLVSLYLIVATDSWWVQALNGLLFAFLTVQAGMLGHDLSHNQVFASERLNQVLGSLVWSLGCGLSQERWYEKHNTHHVFVNHDGHDPDLDIPFIFNSSQTVSGSSTLARLFRPYQHVLFFVLVPAVFLSYIYFSFKYALVESRGSGYVEALLMVVHFAGLLGLVFWALPPGVAILFLVVVSIGAGYYMGFAFAPNHKGMKVVASDDAATWIEQIILTRNIYPSVFHFYLWGGLNYQIEHHLFPYASRFVYGRMQPIVKAYCIREGIAYHETTWSGSVREIYRGLKVNSGH